MPEKRRLFIASPVSESARMALFDIYQKRDSLSARIAGRSRWVQPEQWHLTWLFLGDTEAEKISDYGQRMAQALNGCPPALARLQDLVLWPSAKRPNVLVCRIEPSPALSNVAEILRRVLPEVKDEKPFKPHVTLVRIKPDKSFNKTTTLFQPDPLPPSDWTVDSVVLYQSTLSPTGATYQPLHTITLR